MVFIFINIKILIIKSQFEFKMKIYSECSNFLIYVIKVGILGYFVSEFFSQSPILAIFKVLNGDFSVLSSGNL